MTPQEKELIQSVFARLANHAGDAKDAEAQSLIAENVRRQPDAAYGLVQAVIVLEAGLNQAQAKIAELQRQGAAAPSGGGFLGSSGPWGNASVPRSGAVQPAPAWQQPVQPAGSPWAQPSGGGGFLRNAATMAAGVAGGTLIAEGISSLLAGHRYGYGGGFGGGFGGFGGPGENFEQVTVNNYYGDQGSQNADSGSTDTDYQDASYDDGGYDNGGSDDGFDV